MEGKVASMSTISKATQAEDRELETKRGRLTGNVSRLTATLKSVGQQSQVTSTHGAPTSGQPLQQAITNRSYTKNAVNLGIYQNTSEACQRKCNGDTKWHEPSLGTSVNKEQLSKHKVMSVYTLTI